MMTAIEDTMHWARGQIADARQRTRCPLVCNVIPLDCPVGPLGIDFSGLEGEQIDRDIMRILEDEGYGSPAAPISAQQPQQKDHNLLSSVQDRLTPRPLQQQSTCSYASAFNSAYDTQIWHTSSATLTEPEPSSEHSHLDSPHGGVFSAATAAVCFGQFLPNASSNLENYQSSNLDSLLQGNLDSLLQGNLAGQGLAELTSSGWSALLNPGSASMAGQNPAATNLISTAPTAAHGYDTTPSVDTAAAAAMNYGFAGTAILQGTVISDPAALVETACWQQQQLAGTPASTTAGEAPSAAAAAAAETTDGSSKRGRRSDSSSKGSKKRQRPPPPSERAFEGMKNKVACVTEENAALRAQLAALQTEKSDLVSRMTNLTNKWQATVSELARLHNENLMLIERLSTFENRFSAY